MTGPADDERQRPSLESRLDNLETGLGNVESRLGNVESRLGNVESRLGNVESRLGNVESRLGNVESRLEHVSDDAAAARYLAAAHDRDLADVGIKVDANRRAINALGEQTAARFDQVDQRMDRLENEMRTGFATSAAGQGQIVGLLNHVIARLDDE